MKRVGNHLILIFLLLLCIPLFAVPQVLAADSLTRGNMFTVSIAGRPMTGYYVWFTRTSAMSGEPGDQPPVIVSNQYRVEFDPDGGPYTIGSYRFNNGNGRTIRDDVAPSSGTATNTRYYAKVTTDADGYGIVQFSTSSATADRTFAIRAENPLAPGEEVPVSLGLPVRNEPTAAVPSLRATTTAPDPRAPTAAMPAQAAITPGTRPVIPEETRSLVPAATQQTPFWFGTAISAAVAGLFLMHGNRVRKRDDR